MLNRLRKWLLAAATVMFFAKQVWTASLSNIRVFSNNNHQARVTFIFIGDPEYAFSQINKRRLALDIKHTGVIIPHGGLPPLQFSGKNLLKSIHFGTPKDSHSLRLVIDLTQDSKIYAVKQQPGAKYSVVFTINADPFMVTKRIEETLVIARRRPSESKLNLFRAKNDRLTIVSARSDTAIRKATRTRSRSLVKDKIIIAIDAGHGGQDPGAIGPEGTHEKNVTIAIARKLHMLLNQHPMFKAVMTRDGDNFISVMDRSDVARKQNANFLVSIHADAALNRRVTGASVWVLSNRRANSEMNNWLEEHEKQSELLGGAGDVLMNSQADPYLSQAVLDLQFGHSQRVGYDVAKKILAQLAGIGSIHKHRPEHASMGVLRSPDIPSILVETGFISNRGEERLLASERYQQQLAEAIYNGLRIWFEVHQLQSVPPQDGAAQYKHYYIRRIYAN